MSSLRRLIAALSGLGLAVVGAPAAAETLSRDIACAVGAYRLEGGDHVTLTAQPKGALGYLLPDGERGTLKPQGGGAFVQGAPRAPFSLSLPGCPGERISFGKLGVGHRVYFQEPVFRIPASDVTLSGKMVTPRDRPIRQLAVFVDGSDQTGAVDMTYWQYELPLRGVGVLILDKRGTGASDGKPSANFHQRADDVLAAVKFMRGVLGPKVAVGLIGFSQGGWVAPLAASRGKVDFVVVAYGMAEAVTDEDREEIIQNLQAAGFGPTEIREAVALQSAAAEVVRSHWTTGWEHFDALKARYANAPWLKAMGQEGFTGMMVATPSTTVRVLGPKVDLGVSFEYEPAPVIAALKTRQLWVLGGDDTNAPSARTAAILTRIQQTNRALTVAVFPKADHGIVETSQVDGVTHVRLAAGYLDLAAGWIRTGKAPATPGAVVH